ncbi:MAG: phospholipid carrier-dependent glycosyltransferase [Patescibacteria group bacterium]
MLEKIEKHKILIWLFLLASLNLALFAALYGFHPNNDTYSFIEFIRFFRGEHMSFFFFVPARYLNPFYAVMGATIFRFLTAEQGLIMTNIIFYYGLVFLTYGLIRRVFKSNFIGFTSALIVISGYAMVRYGLTQVQDIGGYFWFLLTIYAGWRWWENTKNKNWLFLGGIAVAFGVLTKESGCMGALFVGILFLLDKVSWKERAFNFIRFSVFPLATIIVNSFRGSAIHYSSLQWFTFNWQTYTTDNYTLFKWFGVHASTYNILWLFIIVGLYFLIKNWRTLDRNIKIYLLAVIPSSMSYYLWSLFVARTVFISAWFFVPIACYGIYRVYMKGRWYRHIAVGMVVLAMITPYIIQSTLRYATLFTIMDLCKNNISCTWDYFWKNRTNFSTTGDVLYFKYKL